MSDYNRRILVIDDNDAIHQDFKKTLNAQASSISATELADAEALLFGKANTTPQSQSTNFQLDSALQGQDGYDMVCQAIKEGNPYAMAFVDMRMPPGWDGVTTIEKLWEADASLQVVICTAYADQTWDDITERLGKTDKLLVLKKPFDDIEVSQIALALTRKWDMTKQAQLKLDELEKIVKDRTETLAYIANHDRLTSLPNREYFTQQLQKAIDERSERSGELGVFFIDFDRFKLINDSLGHDIGDQLLISIAERMMATMTGFATAKSIKKEHWWVGRIGGDEFVVFVDGLSDADAANECAESMRDAMHKAFNLHGHEVYTSPSIGVTTSTIEASSPDQMLRDADAAMYVAKAEGRDRWVVFDRSMHEHSRERLELENAMRRALQDNEFEVYYQPIVCSESARITSVESLVRWNHPKRGLISPGIFIPVAEETGMIMELGAKVLHDAARQTATWRKTLPGCESLNVSVNLSKRQMLEPNLIDLVANSITRSGLPLEGVILEITESVVMEHPEVVSPVLEKLRTMGVSLAMDDFGIGHSSLTCLHTFPIDVLKIDRAFVQNLENNPAYSAVVQAIVTLASNLGMNVTAEGIETRGQLAQIQALDCHAAQGYLFAKPMCVADFEALMQQTHGLFAPRHAAA